jgi:hypothetical protein
VAVAVPESLRWVLTVALVVASAYHLTRVFLSSDRISEALHFTMGASMVAMLWPWGGAVPAPVWVAVFTASTGWFAARAFRGAGRRLVQGVFATSMAAMAWMGATMPAMAASPAMSMPDMPMEHQLTTTGVVSGLLGGYLVVAAGWWFFRGLRLGGLASTPDCGPRPLSWSALCHGLMSAAMGLALLAMA